jgi:hypothetical protein
MGCIAVAENSPRRGWWWFWSDEENGGGSLFVPSPPDDHVVVVGSRSRARGTAAGATALCSDPLSSWGQAAASRKASRDTWWRQHAAGKHAGLISSDSGASRARGRRRAPGGRVLRRRWEAGARGRSGRPLIHREQDGGAGRDTQGRRRRWAGVRRGKGRRAK